MSFRHPLPYHADGAITFAPIAHQPWSMLLDSGPPAQRSGRYDILVTDPHTRIRFSHGVARIDHRQGPAEFIHTQDPLGLVAHQLARHPATPCAGDIPFCGGALGYLGYDIGRYYQPLAQRLPPVSPFPEMALGLYDWAVVVDHHQQRTWLVSSAPPSAANLAQRLRQLSQPQAPPGPGLQRLGEWQVETDEAGYHAAFARIAAYIRAGDCYQVNLARHFSLAVRGDAWPGYLRLRRLNPAPFGAFLRLPEGEVLSSSPERFLWLREGRVETWPIKGTRPRSPDPQQDRRLRDQLAASTKDRAENLMIVDLLRNDLGRCCTPGSISVPGLFEIESFHRVHHLVSRIQGTLAPQLGPLDLLAACFPGGSITGAPKIRAMNIIEELEPCRRGIYCGSIGYIGYNGAMDTNIAIRTLTHSAGQLHFQVGGGIVADSNASDELAETYHKAAAFLEFMA